MAGWVHIQLPAYVAHVRLQLLRVDIPTKSRHGRIGRYQCPLGCVLKYSLGYVIKNIAVFPLGPGNLLIALRKFPGVNLH